MPLETMAEIKARKNQVFISPFRIYEKTKNSLVEEFADVIINGT
jgi:hypothetical protein